MFKVELKLGPRWWYSGQYPRLLLGQSEFKSTQSIYFFVLSQERMKIEWKRGLALFILSWGQASLRLRKEFLRYPCDCLNQILSWSWMSAVRIPAAKVKWQHCWLGECWQKALNSVVWTHSALARGKLEVPKNLKRMHNHELARVKKLSEVLFSLRKILIWIPWLRSWGQYCKIYGQIYGEFIFG